VTSSLDLLDFSADRRQRREETEFHLNNSAQDSHFAFAWQTPFYKQQKVAARSRRHQARLWPNPGFS